MRTTNFYRRIVMSKEWQDVDKVNNAIETLDTFVSDSLDALDWSDKDLNKAEYGWSLIKKRLKEFEEVEDCLKEIEIRRLTDG